MIKSSNLGKTNLYFWNTQKINRTKQVNLIWISSFLETYAEEDGPKKGFSLNGWNENLRRSFATQSPLAPVAVLGQSLMNITMTKTATLATTITGISHDVHWLFPLFFPLRSTSLLDILSSLSSYDEHNWCLYINRKKQNLHQRIKDDELEDKID